MKKILGLGLVAILVMALVGGGTWAYFSDTETSNNNVFSAGTLDLQLEGGDSNVVMFTLSDMTPGDDDGGTPGTLNLTNVGSVTAKLTVATGSANNTESTGTTEFEADGDAGELGAYVQVSLWIDTNNNQTYDIGTDIRLLPNGTASTAGALAFDTIDTYASKTWTDCVSGLAETDFVDLFVEWQFPDSGNQNDAQGDSTGLNFTFTLNQ